MQRGKFAVLITGLLITASASGMTVAHASPAGGAGASTELAAVSASWPNAGHDLANSRNNPDEKILGPGNVSALVPKWSVGFSNNLTATPAVSGGAVYLPDRQGNMWSFDATTGSVRWVHTVGSYTAIPSDISRATPAVDAGRVIFGDQPGTAPHDGAHVIAVSTTTGALLWNTVVDTQPFSKITGAPVIDGDTAYLGISSGEEGNAACCHFRGSVVALDVATGQVRWRTYTAPVGYTGVSVWGGSPAVNHTTGLLYVATGNNYSVPAGVCTVPAQVGCAQPDPSDYVDSLLALNLQTGQPAWALRTLSSDVSSFACSSPTTCGPDFDFGSAPNLFTATIAGTARQLVGVGQKSGVYWTADAQTGALVWQTQVGPGGSLGGIQWGSAVDATRIYVSITNAENRPYTLRPSGQVTTGGAFSALDPSTGAILWQTADPQGAGDFGFVSSANGVVYAGSAAGTGNSMYALDAATGAIRWRFSSGGSVMGGAAIVDGTVYWASGYYTKTCPSAQPTCGTSYRLYSFGLPGGAGTPSLPTGVTATPCASASGPATATISWSPPTNPGSSFITGYRVTRDGVDSSGAGALTATVAATVRSFTMTNLISGRWYHLSVQAMNAAGTGPALTIAVPVQTLAALTAPSAVTVNQSSAGTATVMWMTPTTTAGQRITGYRVTYHETDSSVHDPVSTVVPASARTFSVAALSSGNTYQVSVLAVTAGENGPAAGGRVAIEPYLSAPSSFTVHQTAAASALMTWLPPGSTCGQIIVGYRVTREGVNTVGRGAFATVLPAAARSFLVTKLVVGVSYPLTVQAVTAGTTGVPAQASVTATF